MKETYKKPVVTNDESGRGVFPAVAKAFAVGVGAALLRGKITIDSTHTQTLTSRRTQK